LCLNHGKNDQLRIMAFKKGKKSRSELWNPNTIRRFRNEGRGRSQDHGENYRPWLTVQDVPSLGISSRLVGWKTGRRDVHLLSKLELYHFYICLWDDSIVDFREQFPLDLEDTRALAKEMDIPHPATDVRLTLRNEDGQQRELCRSIKPAGSWTFVFDDLISLDDFVAKLRGQIKSNPVSAWLSAKLSAETKNQVLAFKGGDDRRLCQSLVRELNRIIQSGLIYNSEIFGQISLRKDTLAALRIAETDKGQTVRANRLLLRDAFPLELTKKGPFNRLTGRVREKLDIERRYWTERKNVAWDLLTEADMDLILARNVESLHPYYDLVPYALSEDMKNQVACHLKPLVQDGKESLSELALVTDTDLKLPPNTSLTIARHLIIRKEWKVDLTVPFEPWQPIQILN
jgi:hypothetical protein